MKRWIWMLLWLLCTAGFLISCGKQGEGNTSFSGNTTCTTESSSNESVDFSSVMTLPGQTEIPKNTLPGDILPSISQPDYTVPVQPPTSTPGQEAS